MKYKISKATLILQASHTYYLHPSATPYGLPDGECTVSGTITLKLPKPKEVQSITVTLTNYYDFQLEYLYKSGKLIERKLALDDSLRTYPAGETT